MKKGRHVMRCRSRWCHCCITSPGSISQFDAALLYVQNDLPVYGIFSNETHSRKQACFFVAAYRAYHGNASLEEYRLQRPAQMMQDMGSKGTTIQSKIRSKLHNRVRKRGMLACFRGKRMRCDAVVGFYKRRVFTIFSVEMWNAMLHDGFVGPAYLSAGSKIFLSSV
jgi:hypothetical protein